MTVLDEIVLDEQQGIVLKLFEAPIHESTQIGRRMWVYDGVPFFDRELAEFWESREISSLEKGVMLPTYYEQEERRAFIKKPIVLVQDAKQDRTAGCIWVDGVLYEKNLTGQLVNPRARFHIGFGGCRKILTAFGVPSSSHLMFLVIVDIPRKAHPPVDLMYLYQVLTKRRHPLFSDNPVKLESVK